MDGRERRLQPRVEVRWPVTMLTSEGSMQGETRDISMQGAFIFCDKPLPLSERFVLSVKAPAASYAGAGSSRLGQQLFPG